MVSRVTVRLNSSLINPILMNTANMSVKKAAEKTAQRANANVRAKNRVRTGALASSYVAKQARSTTGRFIAGYDVSSPLPYAKFQEEGIGPVVAKPGKVLRFQPKGMSTFIFRPRTKGFKGAFQLRDAYKALTLQDFLK